MLKGPEIIDSVILCSGRNRDSRRKNTLRDQVVSARSHLSQASSLKQEEHVVRFDSDHPFERERKCLLMLILPLLRSQIQEVSISGVLHHPRSVVP